MSGKTKIEWTEATWNPTTGCTEVSEGCDNCYAKTLAERFRGTPGHYFEHGFDLMMREAKLTEPLRWRRPRKVFVDSMSDLFHKDIPDEYIARVFGVMALAGQHTYQVLTKRPGRMRSLLSSSQFSDLLGECIADLADHPLRKAAGTYRVNYPLPNVWLGTSVENQKWADVRVPLLADTPAAVRFLSCEPLLGSVSIPIECSPSIDWVIVGGESGQRSRPMHPDWARRLRDECTDVGIAFLFKQWGGPRPKSNGRELDGRTWDEYPA